MYFIIIFTSLKKNINALIGDLFGWGNSEYGQLYGDRLKWDQPQTNSPIRLPFDRRVTRVAAGGSSALLLTDTGVICVITITNLFQCLSKQAVVEKK